MDVDLRHMTRDEFYEHMVAEGTAPKLAEMLADRRAPASRTDGDFLRGFGCNGKQFEKDPRIGDLFVEAAKKVDPNFSPVGKVLLGSLSQGPGDLEAWVPADAPRGYIKRLCEKRNVSCEGAVKHTPEPAAPLGKYRVADDIVDRFATEMVAAKPTMHLNEAREAVREQITPKDLV